MLWVSCLWKYSKNIKIDIDKLRQDIQKNESQTEYLLSEIVFDLKEKQTLNEKFNIIKNAIEENGFANTALIYSISETSTWRKYWLGKWKFYKQKQQKYGN